MSDESIPATALQEDTSAAVANSDTAAIEAAPEATATEPEGKEDVTADTELKKENTEPRLLAGKYKSVDDLEKAYKESEKFVTKAKEYEKQLTAYREAEEQARERREIEAQRLGFSDADEQNFRFDVKNHEFCRYVQALETTLSGEAYNRALVALTRYQSSGNPRDLEAAQACFNPAVVAEIAKDAALFEQQRAEEYRQSVSTRRLATIRQNLEEFAQKSQDWLTPKERQDLVGMAVNVTGGNIDLDAVKALIEAAENAAIARYKAQTEAEADNKDVQNSLQIPSGGSALSNGEHWLTREEYNALTPEQESKQYEKIVRQIELEKVGKLPKMLT